MSFFAKPIVNNNFMKNILNALFGLLNFAFLGCSTGYKNEGDAVYYEHWNEGRGQHKNKLEANPKTFQILKYGTYAKDDKSVFYKGEKIMDADIKSFEALHKLYARDKNVGWYGRDSIQTSNGKTFKVVNSYYSTDENDYYYTVKPLKMLNPKNFKFVAGEGDSECWTTDGKYYYYKNYKVPSGDYENLKIYPKSGGISNDRHWAYYLDHKLNYDTDGKWVVDTIDIETFQVTGFIECRDKYGCLNVFQGRVKCEK
jgi:hypothetical protein